MKEVIFLCGMPCSGKSTYRKKHLASHTVISSDDIIDELAAASGKKYDDFFDSSPDPVDGWVQHPAPWMKSFIPADMKVLHEGYLVKSAAREMAALNAQKAVVDMCNLSKGSRSRLLSAFKASGFRTKAVWFISYSLSKQIDLINERSERLGDKTIPASTIMKMHQGFEIPEEGEFDEVEIITPDF